MKNSAFQIAFLFIFGIAAILGVLAFAGYLPGFKSKSAGAAQTVTMWGTITDADFTKELVQFNDTNKAVFALNYVAKDPATYEQVLVEALASGNGPDLFLMPDSFILKHRNKVMVVPYQNYPLSTYTTTFINGASIFLHSDGVIAIPIGVDPLVLYYNQNLFDSNGLASPPETWPDFSTVSGSLTRVDKNTNNVLQAGTALGDFDTINHGLEIWLTFAMQAGSRVIVPDLGNGGYKVALDDTTGQDSQAAINALNFFNQFSNSAQTAYTWNRSMPFSTDAFTEGRVGMYFGLASELPNLQAKNPHLTIGTAVLPQANPAARLTYGHFYGLAVSRSSTKAAVAVQVASVLASKEWAPMLDKYLHLQPLRRDLLGSRQNDPAQDVFFRSTLVTQGVLDPNPTDTKQIFDRMEQNIQAGILETAAAINKAATELRNQLSQLP